MNPALHFSSAVVVCLSVLSCTGALDPHQLELKQHYEHLAYIADFPCLHPQPKVIPVSKLFSESQSHGKAYFPDVTVLHRCNEYTGSCTSGHKCAGKVTELVLLPFKATYLIDTEKHKAGSWAMEYHELLNHTVCGCADPTPKESCHSNMDHKPHSGSPTSSDGNSYPGPGSGGSGSSIGNNYGNSGSPSGSNNGDYASSGGSSNGGAGSSGNNNYENSGSSGSEGSPGSSGAPKGNAYEESSNSNSEVMGSDSTTEDYINALFERK